MYAINNCLTIDGDGIVGAGWDEVMKSSMGQSISRHKSFH